MRNAWLYILKSSNYPVDTYCIKITALTIDVLNKNLQESHWVYPTVVLGYAVADYQNVVRRLEPFLSKQNKNFIHMEISELQKKLEHVIIGKTPIQSQIDLLTFVGSECCRVDQCRVADLFKIYKKNGGKENVPAFVHLLQSVGIQKKKTKYGVLIIGVSPRDPDTIESWWKERIIENEHSVYQKPNEIWNSYEMYVRGNKKINDIVPEPWFWKRLSTLVDFERMKLPNQEVVITFPSAEICKSIIQMSDLDLE
tara:strand:+ start:655 stop:1416 length:762 start_codon:yes stop_codon:yes gene_type:complete